NFPTGGALQDVFRGKSIFASADAAASWNPVNNGLGPDLQVRGIAINPTNPSIVYAATDGGVYRSTSGGLLWQLVCGPVANGVAVDPGNSANVYAACATGIGKSTDGGITWTVNTSISPVNAVAVEPDAPAVVFVGTDHSVFKSTNGGGSWAD